MTMPFEAYRQPRSKEVVPFPALQEIKSTSAELLRVASLAVAASGERLKIAIHEQDGSDMPGPKRFIVFNGRELGKSIEAYAAIERDPSRGPGLVLQMFYAEIMEPLKRTSPECWLAASPKLKELGQSVFTGKALTRWNELF